MSRNQPTIESMILKAGGCEKVAADLDVSASMVRKWRSKNGIPWWHWHYFIALGYNASQIYHAVVAVVGDTYGVPGKSAKK